MNIEMAPSSVPLGGCRRAVINVMQKFISLLISSDGLNSYYQVGIKH